MLEDPNPDAGDPSAPTPSRRWFERRAGVTAMVLVVAVAIAFAVPALSRSDDQAVTPTLASTTAPPSLATTVGPSVAGTIVTVVGTINTVLHNGDFIVNDGHADYTIALSSTVKITDLGGSDVARELLKVDQSVQITGPLEDSTINAQAVLVPSLQPASAPATSHP